MKKRFSALLLAALLLLCASCTPAAEETPTPTLEVTPTPTPTPEPTPILLPWEADPKQFILDSLNAAFSDGILYTRFWLSPGSGPTPEEISEADHGQAIRDLFASYDWEITQKPESDATPFHEFSVQIYDEDLPYCCVGASSCSDVICFYAHNMLCFRADGAENLCRELAALYPSFTTHCALINSSIQETEQATAQLFTDQVFAAMLENGHITDYKASVANAVSEIDGIRIDLTYRVKPAHPELTAWAKEAYEFQDSGWTKERTVSILLLLDPEENICRFDSIELKADVSELLENVSPATAGPSISAGYA